MDNSEVLKCIQIPSASAPGPALLPSSLLLWGHPSMLTLKPLSCVSIYIWSLGSAQPCLLSLLIGALVAIDSSGDQKPRSQLSDI